VHHENPYGSQNESHLQLKFYAVVHGLCLEVSAKNKYEKVNLPLS
jgi:hypothetical protein